MAERPNEGLPSPLQTDIPRVLGVSKGDTICLQRIDPQTGAQLPQKIPQNGMLAASCALSVDNADHLATINKGGHVYIVTLKMIDLQKEHPDEAVWPASTGQIKRIDQMSDGSYWLYTLQSTYRLSIENQSYSIDTNNDALRIHKVLGDDTELMESTDTTIEEK